MKPYSQACENNKDPILEVITPLLSEKQTLLEIGSGTGQHAVYLSKKLPHVSWQTSDRLENHQGINLWIGESEVKNILPPIELDVIESEWPVQKIDSVFSANTAHIMPWDAVQAMFENVGKILNSRGLFILYGPFKYDGQFTSESNENFEQWLKSVDISRGIRDFEALNDLASQNSMRFVQDFEMPANNRILVWKMNA